MALPNKLTFMVVESPTPKENGPVNPLTMKGGVAKGDSIVTADSPVFRMVTTWGALCVPSGTPGKVMKLGLTLTEAFELTPVPVKFATAGIEPPSSVIEKVPL